MPGAFQPQDRSRLPETSVHNPGIDPKGVGHLLSTETLPVPEHHGPANVARERQDFLSQILECLLERATLGGVFALCLRNPQGVGEEQALPYTGISGRETSMAGAGVRRALREP